MKRNYRKNISMKQPALGEMINGQALGEVAAMRYGLFSMSFNGCEVISVCNALTYLGRPRPICEIAAYMEKYKLFCGLFGCKIYRIGRALEHFGVKYSRISPSESAKAFIISSWTGRTLLSSVHTVFCVRDGGVVKVYNRYNGCGHVREYKTAADIFVGRKTIAIYSIDG